MMTVTGGKQERKRVRCYLKACTNITRFIRGLVEGRTDTVGGQVKQNGEKTVKLMDFCSNKKAAAVANRRLSHANVPVRSI